ESYAWERVQGRALEGSDGPVVIAHHPDVQRMLMQMRGLTEGARALIAVAAAARDKSLLHPDESQRMQNKALHEYLVPVVKGFSTEMSVEVASLGIQVHGGMGYIEETGAAQHYRDARILPIYEGTTAIQANDFVGRKVLRDGAAVAAALSKEMRSAVLALRSAADADEQGAEALVLVARRLEAAVEAYERATSFILKQAGESSRAVFMGSVPYLMLAGVVHAGWQMGRAALACREHARAGDSDDFYV